MLLFLLSCKYVFSVIVAFLIFVLIKNVDLHELMHILIVIGYDLLLGKLHGLDILLIFNPYQCFLKPSSVLLDLFSSLQFFCLYFHILRISFEVNWCIVIVYVLDFLLLSVVSQNNVTFNVAVVEDNVLILEDVDSPWNYCGFCLLGQDLVWIQIILA